MLIAFNSAPGRSHRKSRAYGVYAQSLAEMIRTGGLPLPELFNWVRLRVKENTKGALVPWDTQKVDAQFMFFDRAPDAPAQAPAAQTAAFRDKPIRDLGAQDAYSAALDRDTLQGYEDFIMAYPQDPLTKRVRAIVAARREAITWRRTYRTDTPDAYWSYLQRYPRGPHAGDARRRLAILSAAIEPPPTFTVLDYDVPPPPPDEIVYVDRPVLMFSDPDFDFAPPPPPPVYFCHRRRKISWYWSRRHRPSACFTCRCLCSCRFPSMCVRPNMSARHRTTSSTTTFTTRRLLTTSSTRVRRRKTAIRLSRMSRIVRDTRHQERRGRWPGRQGPAVVDERCRRLQPRAQT